MKRTIFSILALVCTIAATAQEERNPQPMATSVGRVYRTEVVPYELRNEADMRDRKLSKHVMEFTPEAVVAADAMAIYGFKTEIPYVWTDGEVYLHLEGVGAAYTLFLNDKEVAAVNDPLTPAEFILTPYIRQGVNDFKILVRENAATSALDMATPPQRPEFEGSYLYYQNRRSIFDFEMELRPDDEGRDFAILDLRVIAQNAYNYEETMTVGYDIYSPDGKLMEFNMVDVTIPGRSTDTVHFHPFIYHSFNYKWEASATKRPPLYKVMLFTRRDGAYKEYMPLRVGFGKTEFKEGKFMRLGKEFTLNKAQYNASGDRATAEKELEALRKAGKNTICPDYPQPEWFYDICDHLGLYVIDRANINAPEKRDDRRVGGTPSNNPSLKEEYISRVKSMYYRSRNHTCVIAYALGGASGNGYNMYKAYEWLKAAAPDRVVIYEDADGEWNSDIF